MHAIVVGAGIGGLASALALGREGYRVTLVEQAPQFGEVGAGVVLGSHAMRVLDRLGAGDRIRAINALPELSHVLDMGSGRLLSESTFGAEAMAVYGIDRRQTHRRDLIDALAERLPEAVSVRLASRVARIEQDDAGVRVHLTGGERIEGDLLVGADGLRSTVRSQLFGESESIFTGYLAWRTVIRAEALGDAQAAHVRVWIGDGRHVVCYPIRGGSQYYAALYVPADEIHREDWSASGDVAELRASFAHVCPQVRQIANAIDEAFITGIFYRDPLPVWHEGRTVLIGDAAHSVLPTSGSGAAFALEDSVTLTACLRRRGGDDTTSLTAAFAEFQERRQARTSRMLHISKADLAAFHETQPKRQAARGAMLRGMGRLDPHGFARLMWLYGHDAVADAERPIDEIRAERRCPLARQEARRAFELLAQAGGAEHAADGWDSERAAYAAMAEAACPMPAGATVERVERGGVPALRIMPPGVPPGGASGPALLHLHGGGFHYGSAESAAGLAARLAQAIGGHALVPDFALAPEHDARHIRDQVLAAYRAMANQAGSFFLSGDGSGANLALQAALAARDENLPAARALYLASPFVDLSLTAASIDAHARSEPWHTRSRLVQLAGAYIQTRDPAESSLSPLNADLSGLPPTLVFCARDEALADDARQLVEALTAAGTPATLTEIADSVHAYPMFAFLPEAQAFHADIAADARMRNAALEADRRKMPERT